MQANCPVCGEAADPVTAVACSDCSAPHHPECWEYNGGCSLFGCGSSDQIDFSKVQGALAKLEKRQLKIDERTRAPVRWGQVAKGVGRWVRHRARDLPGTLAAGIGGALFSIAAYQVIQPPMGDDARLYMAIMLTGGLYGLFSPFLAPFQSRRPRAAALTSVLGFGGLFLLGDWLQVKGDLAMLLVVPLFFLAFLFSSSMSEAVAGYRTYLGEKLGRLALPARLVLSWFFAVGLMLGTVYIDRSGTLPSNRIIMEIAMWGLLAAGTAAPALEQGKRGYQATLEEESVAALPGG